MFGYGLRRTLGGLSVFVGSAMAVAHVIPHLAGMRVRGWAETTMGFPTAALLMMLGLLLLGLQAHPRECSQRSGGSGHGCGHGGDGAG